ncbi:MAG: 1-(5-phosphoribosyl)-5-[(5-phosphoribosylamino)methylideneamino]imidazole-4-carboxamide isomerase [Victivallales bacterium]|nr:1-(5-phosphoribosyl)-5-[(5-phosphoribosylamino)methylideneamino]imidazole-4-carboxamide isomerase [Victivallales bacterium]
MPELMVIPAIDLRGGKCVRLLRGNYGEETVYSDNPADQAMLWQDGGAEFIHLVDLDGAREGEPKNLDVVASIAAAVSVPCELGGGIRSTETARRVLECGIARVILGTLACLDPETVRKMLEQFGPEKIIIGIDAKNGTAAISGWLKDSGMDSFKLAAEFADAGIKRIIYTDIATDGMLTGPNIEAQATLCDKVPRCNVIASGGVSSPSDITKLAKLNKHNLEAVIVGKALYERKASLQDFINAAKNIGFP